MMTFFLIASFFSTSFISGIFGMAGGMILLGILLIFYDVPTAMMIFGIVQIASNGTRTFLWRTFIQWKIVFFYMCGVSLAFMIIFFIAFIPPPYLIYLLLGILPFLSQVMPKKLSPCITKKEGAIVAGIIIMLFQALAGSAGTLIDVFFQKSSLSRKTIVATKAIISCGNQLIRTLYYTLNASLIVSSFGIYIWGISMAMAGTITAGLVLSRMSDESFRQYSKYIIYCISSVYLVYGFYLMVQELYIF
jgi:uncharacterized membrane protein YfcA